MLYMICTEYNTIHKYLFKIFWYFTYVHIYVLYCNVQNKSFRLLFYIIHTYIPRRGKEGKGGKGKGESKGGMEGKEGVWFCVGYENIKKVNSGPPIIICIINSHTLSNRVFVLCVCVC